MEQVVRVRETYSDGTAQVLLIRESACSGDCHKCSGCGAAKETLLVTAQNPIRADVGDLVTIQSDSAPVLKAAAVLYVMPMVLFFLGYALGEMLAVSAGLVGGLGFVLGIVLVVIYDRRVSQKVNTVYTITGDAGKSPAGIREKRG